jgi:hypothetical protein
MAAWEPLAGRLASLPLVLAGPILRRVEPGAVTVWVALRAPRRVTLRVYGRDASGPPSPRLEGARRTVRLGDHLHLAAVTARAPDGNAPLDWGETYEYDLFFAPAAAGDGHAAETADDLRAAGILYRRAEVGLRRLVYPGCALPRVVLPPEALDRLRLFHGSCRKPDGEGHDALAALDGVIADAVAAGASHPQHLFLTGDQIYADGVALPLLFALGDAAGALAGDAREALPAAGADGVAPGPGLRAALVRDEAGFTTGGADSHLLTWAEYAAMYLFAWSDVLWPVAFLTWEELRARNPRVPDPPAEERQREAAAYEHQLERLGAFRASLPAVRRALANVPTYMICDDHDVTDDWYLDGAWCARVLGNPLGRRVVRNALLAYAFFQAWGNDPAQFEAPDGAAFLAAVDGWRGDEDAPEAGAIAEHLGLPEPFAGRGELRRSARALRWDYTLEAPHYRVCVLDTRTRRAYASPDAPPGLLSPAALREQLAPTPAPAALTLVVSPTPVLGVQIVERFQSIAELHQDNYAFDREAWSLDRETHHRLLGVLRALPRVVVLAGDVHYAFASALEYWERAPDGGVSSGRIVNFTSSSLRNPCAGVHKALLTVAYPRIFRLLHGGQMPPIELFVWDATTSHTAALRAALRAIESRWSHVVWALPRLLAVLHAPSTLVLPARGWPPGAFDAYPPDRRERLLYLPDAHQPRAGPPADMLSLVPSEVAPSGAPPDAPAGRLPLIERARLALRDVVRLPGGARGAPAREAHALLRETAEQPGFWAAQWPAGLHVVGDTNIGEVCVDGERREVLQRLWWWAPTAPDRPTPATVYRVGLDPPGPGAAPPLP